MEKFDYSTFAATIKAALDEHNMGFTTEFEMVCAIRAEADAAYVRLMEERIDTFLTEEQS